MRQKIQPSPAAGRLLAALGLLWLAAPAGAPAQPPPTEVPGLAYEEELFPGTEYDPAVPTPGKCLGFRPGDRAAFPHEIEPCLEAWAAARAAWAASISSGRGPSCTLCSEAWAAARAASAAAISSGRAPSSTLASWARASSTAAAAASISSGRAPALSRAYR